MSECNLCNVFWFLVLTNPVLVTSKQLRLHLYPEMSVRKCEYLFVFSLCLASMLAIIGIVSSYMCSVFVCVSTITMSGFSLVTQSSGGIVPPPGASIPGKSLNTVRFLSTLVTMKFTRLLWRQVYLSVSNIVLQQFKMWFVVPLFPQSLHLSLVVYFQRRRFAGVGKVSMLAFIMNFSVPDFN